VNATPPKIHFMKTTKGGELQEKNFFPQKSRRTAINAKKKKKKNAMADRDEKRCGEDLLLNFI